MGVQGRRGAHPVLDASEAIEILSLLDPTSPSPLANPPMAGCGRHSVEYQNREERQARLEKTAPARTDGRGGLPVVSAWSLHSYIP